MRSLARQTLKGKWAEAVMISLLAAIITSVPGMIVSALPGGGGFLSTLVTVYNIVVNGPITLSLSYYFLKVFRMEKASLNDIRYGFAFIVKALHLYCRMFVFVWLWSLLFIIPGIIASIRYSQAFYIMADDESKAAPQCMNESIIIMRGNMIKYVTLMLSFIGWYVLAYIPSGIYAYKYIYPVAVQQIESLVAQGADINQLMGVTVNPGPIFNLLTLPTLVVNVYLSTAEACFFDILSDNLIIRSADDETADTEEPDHAAQLPEAAALSEDTEETEDYNG